MWHTKLRMARIHGLCHEETFQGCTCSFAHWIFILVAEPLICFVIFPLVFSYIFTVGSILQLKCSLSCRTVRAQTKGRVFSRVKLCFSAPSVSLEGVNTLTLLHRCRGQEWVSAMIAIYWCEITRLSHMHSLTLSLFCCLLSFLSFMHIRPHVTKWAHKRTRRETGAHTHTHTNL